MSTETSESTPRNLRNARYCEVIPVTRERNELTSWVYNTLGLNDCPECEWKALTEEQVNQEYGSVAAKLNGPRYWVINELVVSGESVTGERFTFGGIEMELRATLTTKMREGTVGEAFYEPNEVKRSTVYTYNAGEEVYELTSPAPERDVYVMQSYAQIADPTLSINDLPSLGSRLALPEGWSYAPRTLAEDLVLDSNGLAYVINDDLYNAYQRRT
ncbi:MAG TPA: hypothetical protein VF006_17680 [Longimicrobium sp.]